MYTVLNSCRDGDSLSYAVCDFTKGVNIEVLSEEDLKLLVLVGLQARTQSGEPVTVSGDTLVCNVEEVEPDTDGEVESEEDDAYYDFGDGAADEDEATEEVEEDGDAYYDYGDGESTEPEEAESEEEELDPVWDVVDENDPEGSVVSDLYKLLTEEQITVLRRYYLWFSRRLFENAQKNDQANFTIPPAKAAIMKQLRGSHEYRYAGFLDTGSKRAGYYCTLGHPLRYMHIAWDIEVGDIDTAFFGQDYNADYEKVIESNDCIIFGIDCLGDFFEVDDDCIEGLKRAQRATLKDMELLYEIYTGQDTKAVSDSFNLLDSVLKVTDAHDLKAKMLGNIEPVIPFSVSAFYHQFREVGLIPPKSLIQEIRSCLVGWTDGTKYFRNNWAGELKYPYPVFYERLAVIIKKRNKLVADTLASHAYKLRGMRYGRGIDSLLAYVYVFFTYEICGYYKYTAEKDGFKDEGGASEKIREQLHDFYRTSMCNISIVEPKGFSMETLMAYVEFANACLELKASHSDMSVYTLPYYSVYYHTMQETNLPSRGYSKVITLRDEMKRIIDKYTESEDERKHIKNLFCFMVNTIFGSTDVMNDLFFFEKPSNTTASEAHENKDKTFDVVAETEALRKAVTEFDTTFAKLKEFAEAEAVKLEEDDKKRMAEVAAEAERKRIEEEQRKKAEAEMRAAEAEHNGVAKPKTQSEVVRYLQNVDLSGVTDAKYDLAKNILDTLKRKKTDVPSSRQFYYLKALYKEVSGEEFEGDEPAPKVELSARPDIKEAIAWIDKNKAVAKEIADSKGVDDFDRVCSILHSIARYGSISERQMKYAVMAVMIKATADDDN